MFGKCANPECQAEFKRMGTGLLYTLHVTEPQRWGLPAHVKQKVVWLCTKCSHYKKVRFDQQRCEVVLVNRHERFRQSASSQR